MTKEDIQDAVGPLQLCAGHDAGCEAAIHAMRKIFDDEETEGVLLVDAKNAFNSLNRSAALHNCQVLCPSLAPILINIYRSNADLFVAGESIPSQEGVTQGDPLAMAMYALGTLPLIRAVTSLVRIRPGTRMMPPQEGPSDTSGNGGICFPQRVQTLATSPIAQSLG